MAVEEYRQDVERRIADGQVLEQIEAEVIDTAALAQDEKDALWLYALGCEPLSLEQRALSGIAHD